jgi:hypothetical protein
VSIAVAVEHYNGSPAVAQLVLGMADEAQNRQVVHKIGLEIGQTAVVMRQDHMKEQVDHMADYSPAAVEVQMAEFGHTEFDFVHMAGLEDRLGFAHMIAHSLVVRLVHKDMLVVLVLELHHTGHNHFAFGRAVDRHPFGLLAAGNHREDKAQLVEEALVVVAALVGHIAVDEALDTAEQHWDNILGSEQKGQMELEQMVES